MTATLLAPSEKLERLASEFGVRAWRLSVSLMGNATDADDVLQQAFVIAATKESSIPETHPWSWFASVIINVARNARRARGKSSNRFRILEDDVHEDSRSPNPADIAESEELTLRLRGEIEALPDSEREAVVLTHISGLTHQMAASALKVPLGTLKSQVRRGVERLRERMGASESAIASAMLVIPCELPEGGLQVAGRRWLDSASHATGNGSPGAVSKFLSGKSTGWASSALVLLFGIGIGSVVTIPVVDWFSQPTAVTTEADPNRPNNPPPGTAPTKSDRTSTRRIDRSRVASHSGARRGQNGTTTGSGVESDLTDAPDADVSDAQDGEQSASGDATRSDGGTTAKPLPIPYEGWDQYGALTAIEWNEMATSFNNYQSALEEVWGLQRAGKEVSDELKARLATAGMEMERQRFRAIGRVMDSLPTEVHTGRGEWTHPAITANLIAVRLQDAGLALSSDQISSIVDLARLYDQRAAAQGAAGSNPIGTQRVMAELDNKNRFAEGVQSLLTPQQANTIAGESVRGLAGLDPVAPSNMLPLGAGLQNVTAPSNTDATQRLMGQVAAELGLPRQALNGYEYVFDQWIRDTNAANATSTSPTIPGVVTAQALLAAGDAQNRAYQTLISVAPQDTRLQQAIAGSTTIYVPRVEVPAPAPTPVNVGADGTVIPTPVVPGVPEGEDPPATPDGESEGGEAPDGEQHTGQIEGEGDSNGKLARFRPDGTPVEQHSRTAGLLSSGPSQNEAFAAEAPTNTEPDDTPSPEPVVEPAPVVEDPAPGEPIEIWRILLGNSGLPKGSAAPAGATPPSSGTAPSGTQ